MSFIEKYDEPLAWPQKFGAKKASFAHIPYVKDKRDSSAKHHTHSRASVAELANVIVEIEKKIKLLSTRQEFDKLTEKWKNETKFLSNVETKILHPAYQRIISLGKDVLPFILEQLEADMDDWFWALTIISGINPIEVGNEGNIELMTSAWVQWGRKNHLIK